jgi:DNA polymerase III subunit gamma/tau
MEPQSLYRRYRPGRFADVRGQRHVIRALQNAVRDDRVGHAYLLSGPRGTGKTTLARILAKVLNCDDPVDGEPCGVCPSCRSIEAGTSFDLHELDAASNNKVDDMRDLLGKVALGTPGRTKVYLLDEVHMLSSGAENALLKTLEEPPDHVVFVLATTEPHKVVPTVRSRTQHLELTLLDADEMAEHVRWIANDAGLDIGDEVVEYVVRLGGGSVRDTLSALDQVVAAGGISVEDTSTVELLEAIATADAGKALAAVAEAAHLGRDSRVVGEALLGGLRSVFLVAMGATAHHLTDRERTQASAFASRMSPPAITRALELVGTALVDMRQSPDPRIDLEVALVRLTRASTDLSIEALAERLARLERLVAGGAAVPSAAAPAAAPAVAPAGPPPAPPLGPPPAPPLAPAPGAPARPAAEARSHLARPAGESRPAPSRPSRPSPPSPPPAPPTPHAARDARTPRSPADAPSADSASPGADASDAGGPAEVWESVLDALPKRIKVRFASGRFVEDGRAGPALSFPNEVHRSRCEELRPEVEAALAARLGRPVSLRLVADDAAAATAAMPRPRAGGGGARGGEPELLPPDEAIDPDELVDAPPGGGVVEQLTSAFPGAELVDES